MKNNVNDNPENRMKRQWLAIVAVCLVVMTFLTVFLMNRYRTKTEKVFAELMEESLLSSHSEAVTEIEGYLNESEDQEDIEAAWEKLDKDESNIFHYICNSEGEILAGDMIIFDIKYTVATELRSVHVKDKKIAEVEEELKNLTSGEPYLFSQLEKSDVYLVASKLEGRDCILVSGYRSGKMQNYKSVLIKGNRMLIFVLLGCVAIMVVLTARLYLKQQKRVMKGQARYDILSEFSDTVLFEYDCLDKTLVFTPNITTLFGLKEIGPIHPFEENSDFTMVHPDDVGKVKNLLSTIGEDKDEIDDFVIRFKDKNGNYRWVRWMGRLVRGRLGTPQAFLGKISDVQDEMTKEQDLREKASIDGLTGALNRKFAEQKINELMQNKDCKGYLFMLDIDDFKTVNDTMGHAIGDLALITLVKYLKEHFRRDDIVARLGGDEFIVFMTNTEQAAVAEAKGQEILNILAESETTPHFTVSIGAAAYPAAGKDYESLYLAADHAMYVSKKSGKNRIHVDDGITEAAPEHKIDS
ncbi:diguanylate cyclase domain-containing protein [Blautia sp. HCP3S3_H10_1]|uniref:sensor domain-containing diguanylate cyclase n=1 Tax=unclassified Blautia TaxID=2648079 RepID=UPI003F8FA679|nr:sensor domain-containing diguanylate cyclase [Clostridia bacterium]